MDDKEIIDFIYYLHKNKSIKIIEDIDRYCLSHELINFIEVRNLGN